MDKNITLNPTKSACIMDYDFIKFRTNTIEPIKERLAALEKAKGMDGREVTLSKWKFPYTVPPVQGEVPADANAILWRLTPRDDTDIQEWKVLVFLEELRGEKGFKGDKGDIGRGLEIKGVVDHQNDLTLPTLNPAPNLYDIYMVRGVNEAWIWYKSDHQHIANWQNLGKVAGIKGDKGDKGDRGATGASGGISNFMLNWIVGTATNQALTQCQIQINNGMEEILNTLTNQLMNMAEDAAKGVVSKALEDLGDQFKGNKGDKGDKGEDGKDGRSVQIVGTYSLLTSFIHNYPLVRANVGKCAIIKSNPPAMDDGLWAITESLIGTVQTEYLGEFQGVQGEAGKDAEWVIQLRDEQNTALGTPIIIEPVGEGVPNLYIQGYNGVLVEKFQGTDTGFAIRQRNPIPPITYLTEGKYLTNDGTNLSWQFIEKAPVKALYLKSSTANSKKVFKITIDDSGRLAVKESI